MKKKLKQYLVKKANEEMIGRAMQMANGNPHLAAAIAGVPLMAILGAGYGGLQGAVGAGMHGLFSKAHGQAFPKGGILPGMVTATKYGAGIGAGLGGLAGLAGLASQG